MNLDDLFKLSSAIIGSIGGAAIIIIGLSSWLGKVWANRILEKDKLKYTTEIEAIKNQLLIESQKQQFMFALYFEGQFKIYNDLWIALSELQNEVDKLWENASNSNLHSFVKAIKNAKNQIRRSAILIEQEHYEQIISNLNAFEDYQIGKEKLINIRNSNFNNTYGNQINNLIHENDERRQQIKQFINIMLEKIRNQISGRVQ